MPRIFSQDATKARLLDRWLGDLEARIGLGSGEQARMCQEFAELWFPAARTELGAAALDASVATTAADECPELDEARYASRRSLAWLWQLFDASPLALNQALALRFRSLLARHVFAACGEDVRIHQGLRWTFGYGLTLGSRVKVGQDVLLDDRGGLAIEDGVRLADGVAVFSHAHDPADGAMVDLKPTVIGRGARLGHRAVVLAGVRVGEGAIVGAGAVVTRDLEPLSIAVGMPARAIRFRSRGWS